MMTEVPLDSAPLDSAPLDSAPLDSAPAVPNLPPPDRTGLLDADEAAYYAACFACLSDPTRVTVLHTIAISRGGLTVGAIASSLGISQATSSHHVRKLADAGFVHLDKRGTSTHVTVNQACCTGLPHMADIVMGTTAVRPCCPDDLPVDVTVRPMTDADWDDVRRIYQQGMDTGLATFETSVPPAATLDARWLPGHRWVAEVDGLVAGWSAATPTSSRECYSGVIETSVYVDEAFRGQSVGKALMHRQVTAADRDDAIWSLQTAIFTENRASLSLHHQAGYRTVGIRERIAQRDGVWHDTVLLERRCGPADTSQACGPI